MTYRISKKQVYVIAEAGVNHNGKLQLAKKLVKTAKKVGANAVKFQLYNTEELATQSSKLANYQKKNVKNTKSQFELLKKYELSKSFLKAIKNHCHKIKIDFMLSIFDNQSLKMLNEIKYRNVIKIPSGEINNYFLLKEVNFKKNKFIISTGMSDYEDIVNCINTISKRKVYSFDKKKNRLKILNNKFLNLIKKKITLLHCTTDYPAAHKHLNLSVIKAMKNDFKINIGFSDHSKGIDASVGSVYCGASVIEKHLTLNNSLKGPDHIASLNPRNFKLMIDKVRQAEVVMGNNIKKSQICESNNKKAVRKILITKKTIKKGEKFSWKNLTAKRSGSKGFEVSKVHLLIGKKAKIYYNKNQII